MALRERGFRYLHEVRFLPGVGTWKAATSWQWWREEGYSGCVNPSGVRLNRGSWGFNASGIEIGTFHIYFFHMWQRYK